MKTIKICLALLIMLWYWFNQYMVHADIQDDISDLAMKLSQLKKWEKYITAIDMLIEKKKENKIFLNKLTQRLSFLDTKLQLKTDSRSEDLKILLNYLILKTSFALIALEKADEVIISDDEIQENEEIIEEKKSITYPGFSDTYNEYDKTILWWEEAYVYKQSFTSLYEATEVWKVIFYITWPGISNFSESIEKASLYIEWSNIDTVSSSKIDIISSTQAKITFDNLDNFVITQNIRQVRLKVTSSTIGYQQVWKTLKDMYITKVWFDDIIWLSSGNNVNSYTVTKPWELFSIVPGALDLTVEKNLSSNIPEINIKGLFWNNLNEGSYSSPVIELSKLKFLTLGSDNHAGTIYKLSNKDSSSDYIIWVETNGILEFDFSAMSSSNKTINNSSRWEDYRIFIDGTNPDTTLILDLLKSWIIYDVIGVDWSDNINLNLSSDLSLGSKNY